VTRVAIEGLHKVYRDSDRGEDVYAIKGIDLLVEDGTLVSLLGPSGCGKTTTLRCIAGFEPPDGGAIRFNDEDIVAQPPEQRDIGLVFQNYALFPHMTVAENIGFGLEMRKVGKADIQRRVGEVLDMVQMPTYGDRYPSQLSGGQQQRVALARALVIEPRVLLLDEPLANLDAKLREEMRFFIRSLQQRVGITTIYVTHDQSEAMVMSDRVVVMFGGLISQYADPRTIYARPATQQVAEFVGLSNFVAGVVSAREENGVRVAETAIGPLRCTAAEGFDVGDPALILVRPEAISLSRTRPDAGTNVFQGRVSERHFLGHTTDYRLAIASGNVLQVHLNTFSDIEPGAEVWCSFEPEQSWLVSPARGAS
jgi:spermidine/putrescine ABC transporter ATP-binding subunit